MSLYLKDPGARLDYAMDWSAGYLDGQVITASDWNVTPAEEGGLVLVENSHDLTRALAVVADGLPGRSYVLTNRVILSDGVIDERSVTIRVEER